MKELTRRLLDQQFAARKVRYGETQYYQPVQQQKAYLAASEQAAFLKEINHIPVTSQMGERIGVGSSRPLASRTNTEIKDRSTRDPSSLASDLYKCEQTNFDSHIPYRTLDSWAHTGNFQEAYALNLLAQKARDRLMIGWNGLTASEETDLTANPLLQDVNIGWLEKTRLHEPERILGYDSEGEPTTDTYQLGTGGHYGSLDALAFDLITNLLDAWHQASDDLVVMVGREIWTSHGLSLLSNSILPTERVALQTWFAAQTVAGLPCIMPPFMPARAVLITSYKNLSIYYQLDTMRRVVLDNPKRDRIEEYHSQNEAYVIEDYGKFAAIRSDAVLLPDGQGGWK